MMGPVEIHVEAAPETAAHRAAGRVAEIIAARVAEAGQCYIALCGGTTPAELYRCLAAPPLAESVPWQKLHIFFGDERDVPQDHVENNYRLVTKTLLDHVPVPLGQVHPMPADCRDLAAAAEQYENLIRRLVPAGGGELPAFDLIHLGMGREGHTASLFPDTPALTERERLVIAQFVPVIGRNRMTFTYPLINAARNVMFFITGGDKACAVAAVLSDDDERKARYPAARVRPAEGRLIFVLDSAAAAEARPRPA
ncbi:MAG TPA: 6-phosphogluconolactonase [Phycisphaerae bacterium]|nr:6-phosphogluconolactonase [Phycisphaerae bacterium]